MLMLLVALAPGLSATAPQGISLALALASVVLGAWAATASSVFGAPAAALVAALGERAASPDGPAPGVDAVLARVFVDPFLGRASTLALSAEHPAALWGISLALGVTLVVASQWPLPVANRRIEARGASLLPLAFAAIAAASVAPGPGPRLSGADFLPRVFCALLWGSFCLRGLKPTAVVIYYAAASVVGLSLLFSRLVAP